MIDVGKNEYIDYDMGFGALFTEHMNPHVPGCRLSTRARCTSLRVVNSEVGEFG